MNSSATKPEPHFAKEAGIDTSGPPAEDPYQALDDLMMAVEALCPEWPQRPTFSNMSRMLL